MKQFKLEVERNETSVQQAIVLLQHPIFKDSFPQKLKDTLRLKAFGHTVVIENQIFEFNIHINSGVIVEIHYT